jgi:pyruvate/2-oxoglutarate dehydrogenase complex dihydrolipoamide dehydrogenase (E3) component
VLGHDGTPSRFGTEVTVFARSGRILPKEDADIAAIVQERLTEDGVKFELTVKSYTSVQHKDGTVTLNCDMASGEAMAFEFDALLVAAGRRPNVR